MLMHPNATMCTCECIACVLYYTICAEYVLYSELAVAGSEQTMFKPLFAGCAICSPVCVVLPAPLVCLCVRLMSFISFFPHRTHKFLSYPVTCAIQPPRSLPTQSYTHVHLFSTTFHFFPNIPNVPLVPLLTSCIQLAKCNKQERKAQNSPAHRTRKKVMHTPTGERHTHVQRVSSQQM